MELRRMNDLETHSDFTCRLDQSSEPFAHFWEHTVGSGHAPLALRADWQKQMSRCRRELGFQHVRFHGILDDDVGTLMCENNRLVYSFFNADQICDFLLSIGMKPFMELSFMPSTLAAGGETVFHYKGVVTPPRDYAAWATLIEKLVGHWVARYGVREVSQWFFEIWNEPNLKAFWTGTRDDYFKLYETAARAIKHVDPSLKVGGPATANNAWVPEFLGFCEAAHVPVDFVSTHHYPTDSFGRPGDDTLAQLAASHRSVLREEARNVQAQAKGKPLFYTEWCTSSNPFDDLHDRPYAAAFIAKTVMEARTIVNGYSYWTFSDIFEENYFSSVPFHGGFGLMTIDGIPKPAYRAFEILHRLGDEILATEGRHPTVDAWVTRKKGRLTLLLINSSLPRHPIKTETVRVGLEGLVGLKSAYIERIDDDNANARAAWENMGRPQSLDSHAIEALEIASALNKRPMDVRLEEQTALLEIVLPPQGIANVTLEIA